MQWPDPFEMPDGTLLAPDPVLVAHPQVEFLNDSLDIAAYEALLARSDLVVLPYRAASYHQRLSRVAIEAAARGIPLIFTKDTWTAEIAERAGGGVEITAETPEAVANSIRVAGATLSKLKCSARSGAREVSSFHSASGFRRILEEMRCLNSRPPGVAFITPKGG
jgi:glycosyltransferase involved in cell wall biosynthesis